MAASVCTAMFPQFLEGVEGSNCREPVGRGLQGPNKVPSLPLGKRDYGCWEWTEKVVVYNVKHVCSTPGKESHPVVCKASSMQERQGRCMDCV